MDVLVALGTGITYTYSVFSLMVNIYQGESILEQYFETCVFLIFFVILGKFLESYAKGYYLIFIFRSNFSSNYKASSVNSR